MHARQAHFNSPRWALRAVETFSAQLPQYQKMRGYKGFTMLANRHSGKVIGVSFRQQEDDLRASDELGQARVP